MKTIPARWWWGSALAGLIEGLGAAFYWMVTAATFGKGFWATMNAVASEQALGEILQGHWPQALNHLADARKLIRQARDKRGASAHMRLQRKNLSEQIDRSEREVRKHSLSSVDAVESLVIAINREAIEHARLEGLGPYQKR